MQRCRTDSQVGNMREHMLTLLISEADVGGSETKLSYDEVAMIMDYIDTYWLTNPTILYAFVDARFLDVEAYETTGASIFSKCTTSYSSRCFPHIPLFAFLTSLSLPGLPDQITLWRECGVGLMVSDPLLYPLVQAAFNISRTITPQSTI